MLRTSLRSSLRTSRLLLCCAAAFPLTSTISVERSFAAEDAITSVDKAGADFAIQGEYTGILEPWGGAVGAQVIALGNSEFDVVFFPGGLPGDGFKLDAEKKTAKVKSEGSNASGKGEAFGIDIGSNKLKVSDSAGKSLGELTKVNRESTTLGAKPPQGATVLFDGSSADKFKGGKLIEEKLLGVGCETSDTWEDHTLHIEFRTPYMPTARGQGRGNSGVYFQGRYELQVLDSFGLKGADNECGGIYQIAKPKVNMCYPPLSWQTYDIDFKSAKYDASGKKVKNAVVTIRHNGVVIHDQLELPKHTPGKNEEANSPGPLYLQDHGNPVAFRNIWITK